MIWYFFLEEQKKNSWLKFKSIGQIKLYGGIWNNSLEEHLGTLKRCPVLFFSGIDPHREDWEFKQKEG